MKNTAEEFETTYLKAKVEELEKRNQALLEQLTKFELIKPRVFVLEGIEAKDIDFNAQEELVKLRQQLKIVLKLVESYRIQIARGWNPNNLIDMGVQIKLAEENYNKEMEKLNA